MKIFRVVVRGQFSDLDEAQRASLLTNLRDHDFLKSSFTADGTFTYDARLDSFNLRFEVRKNDESIAALSPLEVEDALAGEMVDKAQAWLQNAGHPYKRLKATVTDMASMWTS